jgi:Ca2+:H+ antiporter
MVRAVSLGVDSRELRPYLWAFVLLLFLPVSVGLQIMVGAGIATFITAGLGIVPLAWFMGIATEEIGKHAGPGVGGLLNATFGNATELIIAVFALTRGLQDVVKASLTGSIIGNLLLVLGLSMVAGGLRHKTQSFSREASGIHTTMLLVAVIGLIMPALYVFSARATGAVNAAVLDEMSLGIAAILLAVYVFGLIFSLKTHRDIFNPVSEKEEKSRWSLRGAVLVLVVATLLVAGASELLVGSLEVVRISLGLTDLFLGVIIVAIVGNAAEHGSAILMARRNKMDLSLAVAMTSTTQIALFVAPVLVFVSLLTAQVMTLDFEVFELVSVALSTALLASVVSDGRSNWFEGLLLVMVYAMIGVAFFVHP